MEKQQLNRLRAEQLKELVYWYNPPRKSYYNTKAKRIEFLINIPEIVNNIREIIDNIREISTSLHVIPHRPDQNTPLPIPTPPQTNLSNPPSDTSQDLSNVFIPETPPPNKYHYYCIHKRQKLRCKECGGAQICEHNRNKAYCRDCGGSQICGHKKQRNQCKECGGSQICIHKKQKARCKECGGKGICIHGKQRNFCKLCGGSQICEHNRQKAFCKECYEKH